VVKLTGGSHLSARGREGKREGGLAGVCWADRFGWVGCAKTGRGGKKKRRRWVAAGKEGEEEGLIFFFLFSTLLKQNFQTFSSFQNYVKNF
jgi:hypothetical protein